MVDASRPEEAQTFVEAATAGVPLQLRVHNKSDLLGRVPDDDDSTVHVSARDGQGIDALRRRLRQLAFGEAGTGAGEFTARVPSADEVFTPEILALTQDSRPRLG